MTRSDTPDWIKHRTLEGQALGYEVHYARAFYEGNSRTLREFTRELAAEAGFTLNWAHTGTGAPAIRQRLKRKAAAWDDGFLATLVKQDKASLDFTLPLFAFS